MSQQSPGPFDFALRTSLPGLTLILAGALACGGGEKTPADSAAAPPPAAPAPAPMVLDPAGITPQLLALGDSIFHGTAGGGLCYTCHGPDGKGVAGLGADLTDQEWLHSDGSWGAIYGTVQTGVAQPTKSPTMMPPMGGAQLTPDQIRAVSAYAYRLGHKAG